MTDALDLDNTEEQNRDAGCSVWSNSTSAVIHITDKCNLSCKYCFEGCLNRPDMTKEIIDRIVDMVSDSVYFRSISKGVESSPLSYSFFGGEPLVRFDLIKYAVEKIKKNSRKVSSSFGVTTNGTLLSKEIVDFFVDNNFSMILSIDGPRDIHDENRVFKNGSGSYDVVIENSKYAIEKMGKRITVRPSFTPKTSLRLFETVSHLAKAGFTSISPIPTIDVGREGVCESWDEVIPRLVQQMYMISDWWFECLKIRKDIDIKFIRDFFKNFGKGQQPNRSLACGTGIYYQAFSPDGNIFPCHRWTNDINYKDRIISSVFDGNISKEKQASLKIFRNNFKSSVYNCDSCFFENMCSKGCNVVNFKTCGDRTVLPKFQCDWENIIFKNGIRILSRYGTGKLIWRSSATRTGLLRDIIISALPKKKTTTANPDKKEDCGCGKVQQDCDQDCCNKEIEVNNKEIIK